MTLKESTADTAYKVGDFCPMKIDHTSGMTLYLVTFTNRKFVLYLEKWTSHPSGMTLQEGFP